MIPLPSLKNVKVNVTNQEENSQHAINVNTQSNQNNFNQNQNKDLNTGLNIIGKNYIPVMQWIGKFAQQQYNHQIQSLKQQEQERQALQQPKRFDFNRKLINNLANFTYVTCPLCLIQKPKEEIMSIAGCSHKFCYSCLNSYAISRIQDLNLVVCPHPTCGKTMNLNNKVYRFLPDQIKIKFLSNKNLFRYNQDEQNKKCPRCLQQRHPGQCKVIMKPQTIEMSFKYRNCGKCQKQANVTQGKKKIICKRCKHQFCYICGKDWQAKGSHNCGSKQNIRQLQKQFKIVSGSTCNWCTCCDIKCSCCDNCCQCDCCDNVSCCDCSKCQQRCADCFQCCDCEKCLEYCYDCRNLSVLNCIGGTLFLPIRVLFVLLYFAIVLNIIVVLLSVVVIWAMGMFLLTIFLGPCMMLQKNIECCIIVLFIIFYPISIFILWIFLMYQGSDVLDGMLFSPIKAQCQVLIHIWVCTSPQEMC